MRIYNAALKDAGHAARVDHVIDDKKRGLVAKVSLNGATEGDVSAVLNSFTNPWDAA